MPANISKRRHLLWGERDIFILTVQTTHLRDLWQVDQVQSNWSSILRERTSFCHRGLMHNYT